MLQPQLHDFAGQFFHNSDQFYKNTGSKEKKIKLGKTLIKISVPTQTSYMEPEILGGFIGQDDSAQPHQASICLFDDRFGSVLPEGTWPSDLHYPLGIINEKLTAPYKIAIDRHTNTVSVFDTTHNRCAVWIKSTSQLPYWAAATSFRLQLSWIANLFNAELTHAAAIECQGNALLISGASGAGKSTVSIIASQNGFGLIGDDYVLIDGNEVSAVYTRAKLHDSSFGLPNMNKLAVLNSDAHNEKRIIDLRASPDIAIKNTATIKGIALPIQADMNAFQPISSGKALKMIAPSSLSGLLGGSPSSLTRLRNLVSSVPAFRWALSNDIEKDMNTLREIWKAIA